MKIFIGSGDAAREYPSVSPERAELIHLMELRQQTKAVHPGGFGMQAIKDLGAKVAAARKAGGEPDEDDALLFLGVMVFLARRGAGENVTFTDACSVPLGDVRVEPEPHEVEASDEESAGESPDPTPAAGDEPSGELVEWRRPARKKAPAKAAPKAAVRKRAASR